MEQSKTIEVLETSISLETFLQQPETNCLDYGTQLGWLIDPSELCILVYAPYQ